MSEYSMRIGNSNGPTVSIILSVWARGAWKPTKGNQRWIRGIRSQKWTLRFPGSRLRDVRDAFQRSVLRWPDPSRTLPPGCGTDLHDKNGEKYWASQLPRSRFHCPEPRQ